MVMQHHEPESHAEKNLLAIFMVKVTARVHMIKKWFVLLYLQNCCFFFQPNLVWWYINMSQSVLWKKWITAFKIKVTEKVQNFNECLSAYFLSCQTFCYQTWYGDASSWASVPCKKIGLLFSRSRSQQWIIWSKYDSLYYISKLLILLLPNLVWWYIIISWSDLWRNWTAVFKISVTTKLQNVNECLSW